MTATPLAVLGSIAGTVTGATPTPVVLNATYAAASMTALTTGTNVLFSFPNNGAVIVVVYNTAAAGGAVWSPTLYPTTAGAPGAAVLGTVLPLTTIQSTLNSVIGANVIGPFGPSKFNDSNGLAYVTQVGASAVSSYIGVFSVPGALS
jgi:hypothetical protein